VWKKEMTMEKQLVDKEPEFTSSNLPLEEALFKYEEKMEISCLSQDDNLYGAMIGRRISVFIYECRFAG
jgi:hypothetical protein